MAYRPNLRRAGLTLIELLVGIAIVGGMLALLLPAIQSARASTRRTVCANQMRQLGLAIAQYAQVNYSRFPETSHTAGLEFDRAWIETVAPYLENVDDVRFCPSDPKRAERARNGGTSYLLNEYLTVPGKNARLTTAQLRGASRTILAFESSDRRGTAVTEDHTHSRNWFRKQDDAWKRISADIQTHRHEGASNYLFADYHVETIGEGVLRALAEKQVDFSLPDSFDANYLRTE